MVERRAIDGKDKATEQAGARDPPTSGHITQASTRAESGDDEGVEEAERKLDDAVGPKMEIRGGHSIQAGGNELDDR